MASEHFANKIELPIDALFRLYGVTDVAAALEFLNFDSYMTWFWGAGEGAPPIEITACPNPYDVDPTVGLADFAPINTGHAFTDYGTATEGVDWTMPEGSGFHEAMPWTPTSKYGWYVFDYAFVISSDPLSYEAAPGSPPVGLITMETAGFQTVPNPLAGRSTYLEFNFQEILPLEGFRSPLMPSIYNRGPDPAYIFQFHVRAQLIKPTGD
jgi:hypothetical protein